MMSGSMRAQQDHGYAWAILVITVVYNSLEASLFLSPAVYLMYWDETFDVSKAQLGSLGSLMNSVASFTGE